MEIKALCDLFGRNLLNAAEAVPADEEGGWLLFVTTVAGDRETVTKIRSTDDKIYSSIRGALSDAKKIGFKEVNVKLS